MLSGRQKLLGALLVGATVVLVGYSISHAFGESAPTNEVSVPAEAAAEPQVTEELSGAAAANSAVPATSADTAAPSAESAPLAVSEAQNQPQNRLYTVQSNDSFWSIAKKVYGDGKYVNKLVAANAGHKTLRSGMRIVCPPFEGTSFKLDLPGMDEAADAGTGADLQPVVSAPAVVEAPSLSVPVDVPPNATIAPAVSVRTHTVRSGENLYDIAKKYYHNGSAWPKIAAANPTVKANAIKPGQTLQIP